MDQELIHTVLLAAEAIPAGQTRSYGDIAAEVGTGPRQVATIMAQFGSTVPWWRVIRSDGTIAERVRARATAKLTAEGVKVTNGRVQPTPTG